MHCIILLPCAAGRLPTAKELRQRGFAVSAAVLLPEPSRATDVSAPELAAAKDNSLALAAEAPAPYGRQGRQES